MDYDILKKQIDSKDGSLTKKELDLLYSFLVNRNTVNLCAIRNSRLKKRETKSEQAEFLLCTKILKDRNRRCVKE